MSRVFPNLLFVYGTLLSADIGKTGRSQRERLARETCVLGAATVPGTLYNLGRYPALVEIRDSSIFSPPSPGTGDAGCRKIEVSGTSPRISLVHGELLELADPVRSFQWLDAYEGIVPGKHSHNDYERQPATVTRPDGSTTSAWVYTWRAPLPSTATLIPGGNWLNR